MVYSNPTPQIRKIMLVIISIFGLNGCSLVTNTIEAPFVAVDHVFNGKSNREKIRELRKSNRNLKEDKDNLSEEISILQKQNMTLKEQGKAFEALVSVFESNPCFHVHRQGKFQVLIQPRLDERCVE